MYTIACGTQDRELLNGTSLTAYMCLYLALQQKHAVSASCTQVCPLKQAIQGTEARDGGSECTSTPCSHASPSMWTHASQMTRILEEEESSTRQSAGNSFADFLGCLAVSNGGSLSIDPLLCSLLACLLSLLSGGFRHCPRAHLLTIILQLTLLP